MKERKRKCEESDPVGAAYMAARMATAPTSSGHCTYILWTLHRRPCPPGKDCTVYERASDEQRKKAKNNIVIIPAATPKPPKPSRRTWDTAKALQMYQDGASDVQIAKACRECHRPQSACGGKDRACRHTQSRSSGRAHGTLRRRGRCTMMARPTGKSPRPLGSVRLQSVNGGKKKACRRT